MIKLVNNKVLNINNVKNKFDRPISLINTIPMNAPVPAPKSHHVLTLDMACRELLVRLLLIATNGEKVTTIVLNTNAIVIPTIR